jgi:transcriptional regulator with XRE-family HTH domain
MQTQVAVRLGVHKGSVQNWERGVGQPGIRQLPAIIEFLGYDPEPEPKSLPDRVAYARRRLGFTQEELATRLAVNPVTIWNWESGHYIPPKARLRQIQHLLSRAQVVGFVL